MIHLSEVFARAVDKGYDIAREMNSVVKGGALVAAALMGIENPALIPGDTGHRRFNTMALRIAAETKNYPLFCTLLERSVNDPAFITKRNGQVTSGPNRFLKNEDWRRIEKACLHDSILDRLLCTYDDHRSADDWRASCVSIAKENHGEQVRGSAVIPLPAV